MYPANLHIVKGGGIFLRIILLTIAILLTAYIVKTDLSEGTLSHASFYTAPTEEECVKEITMSSVSVQIHEGDTLQSLLAIHPSPVEITHLERLAYFYELNPHLQKQALLVGEIISLPILLEQVNSCSK